MNFVHGVRFSTFGNSAVGFGKGKGKIPEIPKKTLLIKKLIPLKGD